MLTPHNGFTVFIKGQVSGSNPQFAVEGLEIIRSSLEAHQNAWDTPNYIERVRANSSEIKDYLRDDAQVLRIESKTPYLKQKLEAALKLASVADGVRGFFYGAVIEPAGKPVVVVNEEGRKRLLTYLKTHPAKDIGFIRS